MAILSGPDVAGDSRTWRKDYRARGSQILDWLSPFPVCSLWKLPNTLWASVSLAVGQRRLHCACFSELFTKTTWANGLPRILKRLKGYTLAWFPSLLQQTHNNVTAYTTTTEYLLFVRRCSEDWKCSSPLFFIISHGEGVNLEGRYAWSNALI